MISNGIHLDFSTIAGWLEPWQFACGNRMHQVTACGQMTSQPHHALLPGPLESQKPPSSQLAANVSDAMEWSNNEMMIPPAGLPACLFGRHPISHSSILQPDRALLPRTLQTPPGRGGQGRCRQRHPQHGLRRRSHG